ncbi:MFS transporter [Kutzneria sp. 744]|uniref:MFS transporter n=1 Tax=Kutzneria sp. (strain 744) TaxID=345341 RepID=UPI0003EEBEEB|nr:MFS transporter [Kutzneria sp. 744]EWM11316.1 hypothetical protein KUTG_01620 [Kutzneria sp. 744]
MASSSSTTSPWAPLAAGTFRALWLAQFASNVGTWVQSVGAQWLVLDHGPTVVALVQTASTLPAFMFALPAGVLADLADRKRLLVWAQLFMTVVAALLAVATFTGGMTPGLLLTLTFLLGCGSALVGPAWQAIQPELVPREQLKQASALGAVNMNIARAVGPALGGLLVSVAGIGWTFALNAVSFVVILVALQLWRRPPQARPNETEREHTVAAVRAGVRYLRNAPGIRYLGRYWSFLCGGTTFVDAPPITNHYHVQVTIVSARRNRRLTSRDNLSARTNSCRYRTKQLE